MFENEDEWISDRNDQWRKFRSGDVDEDVMNARASLLEHPDVYNINHEGRGGWEVAHGATGTRKKVSYLVRRHGGRVLAKISPPRRAVWSAKGNDREWTLTQEGEGPTYERKANSLSEIVKLADTPPKPEHLLSEEPHERSPEHSFARNARDALRDLEDERLWRITPIARKHRLSSFKSLGAVSRVLDTIWR